MEVLLFALFFISALVFFIAGKDDFGRTESKLIIKEEENIKKKDKFAEEIKEEENIKKKDKFAEEINKEDKVTGEENIEPQKELKKESKL